MTGSRLVDLSHEIEHGLVTYRGMPAPEIGDWLSRDASTAKYAPGTTFQIGRITMIANTGTYIDAPFHRYADGADISGYALNAVANLPGIVVRATRREGRAIDAVKFAGLDVRGRAVLVHTGWDSNWATEQYASGHPFLTAAAARTLIAAQPALVGIDSLNIDDDTDRARPVHTSLLGEGIAIVEHLTGLGNLPDSGFRFFAVPPRVKGMGSFPVRAFAIVA
jgi:arylformamidase